MEPELIKLKCNHHESKINEFILASGKHDCVCITETWLNNTIDDGEVSFPGYTTYRKDRLFTNKSRGGGVMFFVRNNILSLRGSEF